MGLLGTGVLAIWNSIIPVECNDPDLTDPLLRGLLARLAAEPETVVGTYRLQISLDRR